MHFLPLRANKKIAFSTSPSEQKKNSKEEKINKIQQEFSQRESCLLSKQDFFFGGEGVGALRESSLRGCESQIT